MSILNSKPQKTYTLIDPIFVLLLASLVLLVFFAVFPGNVASVVSDLFGPADHVAIQTTESTAASFGADLWYWEANCSNGWSSDSVCDTIVIRTQACSIAVNSAYCSEYESYLQQYRNK